VGCIDVRGWGKSPVFPGWGDCEFHVSASHQGHSRASKVSGGAPGEPDQGGRRIQGYWAGKRGENLQNPAGAKAVLNATCLLQDGEGEKKKDDLTEISRGTRVTFVRSKREAEGGNREAVLKSPRRVLIWKSTRQI